MALSIYARYLIRRQIRAVIIWGLALGALAIWTIAYYPTFSKGGFVTQYLDAMPDSLKAVLNVSGDLSTIQGWVSLEVFNLMVPLSLPFYAIIIGSKAVAGAEQQRRLDIILSAPLRRSELIGATLFEMVAGVTGIAAVLALCTWIPARLVDTNLTAGQTLSAVVNLIPLTLFFGAVALVASTIVRRTGAAAGIAGGLLVAMYFINGFGQYVQSLSGARKATVFYHYGSAIMHGISWGSWGVILGCAVTLAGVAVPIFNRRDIYT